MKRLVLAAGLLALVEFLLLWRLVQRTSLPFAGAYLVLSAVAGGAVMARTARQALGMKPAPRNAASATDRLWILLAGMLLIVPGILSDLVGLVLLMPSGRALVRRWLGPRLRGWTSGVSTRSGNWSGFSGTPGAGSDANLDEHTIDVTSRPVAPRRRVSSRKK